MTDRHEDPTFSAEPSEELTLVRPSRLEQPAAVEISADAVPELPLNADLDTTSDIETRNGRSEAIESLPARLLPVPPPLPSPIDTYVAVRKWKGQVVSANEDSFAAILTPVDGDGAQLAAEIVVDDVTEQDRSLIRDGAVFYWSIGYLKKPTGTIKASILRFRRLPEWSERDIALGKRRAQRHRFLQELE